MHLPSGGHSHWPLLLSVAQHSLTVLMLRARHDDITPALALYELLHHAEDSLIGVGLRHTNETAALRWIAAVSACLTAAVRVRYNLRALTQKQHTCHKHADRLAAACEARHAAGRSDDEIRDTLGIEHRPLDSYSIGAIGFAIWEPWPAHIAARK